jgi:type IV secretion system protein VirD4
MAKGQKKGLFPIRSVGFGLVLIAAGWFTTAFNTLYSYGLIAVGLLFLVGRPWYWIARGRHGAKAGIARSERKQERSGGVMSRWDHMKNFSATAMRLKWARSLQPTRDDLGGLRGFWTILREPVTRYAAVIGKDNYGKKYVPTNSIVVRLAAARSGKSVALADRILNHYGPAIVTSTRTDQVDMTAELRAMKFGPVYFFNAGQVGNIDSTLKWSVLTGCKDMNTAQRRAADLVGPIQEGTEGARWDSKAIDVLGPLMYVAAHHGLPMRAVAGWIGTGQEERAEVWDDIRRMLLDTPDGHFAEEALNQFFKINDRTLTSITSSLLPALAWLTNPNTATLGDSEDAEFDIERDLIDADATLYILGKKERGVGALTGALVAEIGGLPGSADRRAATGRQARPRDAAGPRRAAADRSGPGRQVGPGHGRPRLHLRHGRPAARRPRLGVG